MRSISLFKTVTQTPLTASSLKIVRSRSTFGFSSRTMATTTAPQREWLVIIPDHQDKLDKRLEIRAAHLEKVLPRVEEDKVRIGGATLGAPLEEGKPPQMTGSAFILRAETEQEVREFLASDIYSKEGVWNLEKTSIIPFRTAVKSPSN